MLTEFHCIPQRLRDIPIILIYGIKFAESLKIFIFGMWEKYSPDYKHIRHKNSQWKYPR